LAWEAYRRTHRGGQKRHEAYREWENAVAAIAKRPGIIEAAQWLVDRVQAYASSWHGQTSEYTPLFCNWLRDGGYDDDVPMSGLESFASRDDDPTVIDVEFSRSGTARAPAALPAVAALPSIVPAPTARIEQSSVNINEDGFVDGGVTMLPLNWIDFGPARSVREDPCLETVSRYLEKIKAGERFPPMRAYYDKSLRKFIAWDGWHRSEAYRQKSPASCVPVIVKYGTREDAVRSSLSANDGHGLPRRPGDKRAAVLVALTHAEHGLLSDRGIAELCRVSPTFVGKVRQDWAAKAKPGPAETAADAGVHVDNSRRTGRDGKKYKPAKPKPLPPPAHEREPGDESEPTGEAPIELSDEQLDTFIASLPLDPEEAFESAQHVDELLKAISRVKQLLERAGNGPAGRLLDVESERQGLTKLYERVKSSRPYAICPKPVNAADHSGCKVCRGAGFITKETKVPASFQSLALSKFEEMDFPPHSTATVKRIPLGYTSQDDKEFYAKAGHLFRWLHDQPKRLGVSHRTPEFQMLKAAEEALWDAYDGFLDMTATVQRDRSETTEHLPSRAPQLRRLPEALSHKVSSTQQA